MNVLFVADVNIEPVIGGGERVLREHCLGLIKKGHEVHLITKGEEKKHEKICGVNVYYYPVDKRNIITAFLSALLNSKKLFKELLKKYNPPDIINFHQPLSAYNICTSIETKKVKKVYTFLSSWAEEYSIREDNPTTIGKFIRHYIERSCLNNVDRIICLSNYAYQKVIDLHHIDKSKITIIEGGVDIDKFKPAKDKNKIRKELGLPTNKFLLFTVRNLVARMGLNNLIYAMEIVKKEVKNVYLIIGGEGPLENYLKNLTKELSLTDCIHFTGFIEEEKLPLFYQAADLFILPTVALESFGLVTVEALASGLPVLGTKIGGTYEILGKLNKDFLFDTTSYQDIAKLIIKYCKEDLSKWQEKCREFAVKNYTWEKQIDKLEEVYKEMI